MRTCIIAIMESWPVVLVCWPLTRTPQKWRRPLCARIFFKRSKSSRNFESTWLERSWESLPSTISFCLFRNQRGILNWRGFWRIVTMRSNSSELRSPALAACEWMTGRIRCQSPRTVSSSQRQLFCRQYLHNDGQHPWFRSGRTLFFVYHLRLCSTIVRCANISSVYRRMKRDLCDLLGIVGVLREGRGT